MLSIIEQLPVDTASQRNSIWRQVGWDSFRKRLVTLQRACNEVPGDPKVHSTSEWQAEHTDDTDIKRLLPFDVEQRLADDIAFLAAAEEGPKEVSAVALEEQTQHEGLVVRLAANGLVPCAVKDTVRAIFDLLNKCASRDLSRDRCAQSLFDLVVELNQNRIHGRLQSVHWNRPKSRLGNKPREPLYLGLRKVAQQLELEKDRGTPDLVLLHDGIYHLCSVLQEVEMCGKSAFDCRETLCQIVKESYNLCTSAGTSTLEETIRIHGFSKDDVFCNKYIRQVDKIGRYWGLCKSMAEDSRKYAKAFTHIQLEVLRPYQAKSSSIAFTNGQRARCLVHAEMQIIAFYGKASNATLKTPRVIGVSKSACYLCNLFIQEHKRFFVTKTHGRLYERWNFPDLEDFDPRERAGFRRILARIDQELQTALAKAGKSLKKRKYPMGSWLTLPPARQVSPVPSTVRSVASKDPIESDKRHVSSSVIRGHDEVSPPTPCPLPASSLALTPPPAYAPGLMDQKNGTPAYVPTPPPESSCTKPAVGDGRETSLSSRSMESWELPAQREFTAVAPVRTRIGGISLTFETEGAARGSVAIAWNVGSKNSIHASSIDVGALKPGEAREFAREAENENMLLNLAHSQGQSAQITLRWL